MWETVKLSDVCELAYGKALDKGERLELGGYPAYGANGVKTQSKKPLWNKPSIIIGRKGSAGEINKVTEPFWALDVTYYTKIDESVISLDYLFYVLTTLNLPALARGVKPGINRNDVYEQTVPLPPLAEQQRIVAKLDAAFAEIDRLEQTVDKAITLTDELFLQVLDKAFAEISPESVKEVGDFAEHCLGKMLDKKKNKGVLHPYLRNLNVRWFKVTTDDLLEMRIDDAEHERYSTKKGDLLICEGGYPGRCAIWEHDEPLYIQKALHRVRCREPEYNKWLMYYLYYLDKTDRLKKYFTGSGIQHFTGKALNKLPVPLPDKHAAVNWIVTFDQARAKTTRLNKINIKKKEQLNSLRGALLKSHIKAGEAA